MISEKSDTSKNEEQSSKQLTLSGSILTESSGLISEYRLLFDSLIRIAVLLIVIVGVVLIPITGYAISEIVISIAIGIIIERLRLTEKFERRW